MNLRKFLIFFIVMILATTQLVGVFSFIRPRQAIALNIREISVIARNITVKVINTNTNNNFSGVLLERQNTFYSVITINSVANEEATYNIQTFDGIKHQATSKRKFPGLDLMVLTFESTNTYDVSNLGNSDTIVPLQTIFVAGYSTTQSVLDLTSGSVRSIREDALVYTNQTLAGSKGGAVIDEDGYLIAINGEAERDFTTKRNLSRGIPINILLSILDAEQQISIEESERRLALEEKLLANDNSSQLSLNENAEEVTVKISGHGNGSGVIFLKENNIYSVVTNQHVTPIETDYTIRTVDGTNHPVISRQEISGLDLAIIQFESDEEYYTASLGDSDELERLEQIYVAGFPGEQTDLALISGEITTIRQDILQDPSLEKGYALNYDNNTFGGTSGGAILNEEGILMGINGEAEFDGATGRTISRGIPINLFIDAWVELNLRAN